MITESLFTPLKANGLTHLKISYDFRRDSFTLFAAKLWDKGFDFSQYNASFNLNSSLTNHTSYLNTEEVESLFQTHQLQAYLERIKALMREGKHEAIECYYLDEQNIRFMCHQHSVRLGINNKSHALMAGGIRRHGLDESEIDVIIDGLNLGRAMSFKNVAAGLPFGGCKTTVHMDPLNLDDLHVMGFLAYSLDRSRCFTGPDMNFPTEMADVMTTHFSLQFTGGPNAPLGETGKPTAYGTFIALKEAVKIYFDDPNKTLKDLRVAVQGLGAVGWYMAEHLIEAGAHLLICDLDPRRVDKLKTKYPKASIQAVLPDEFLLQEADILCPCAMGGIIHEDNIDSLSFKLIFGPANNQLKATSQEQEIALAKRLAQRGILYQIEWWHNTAGVLCGAHEYQYGKGAHYDQLIENIDAILPSKTIENLLNAKAQGITPTESAYQLCDQVIYL